MTNLPFPPTWPSFYETFATNLLPYKSNRLLLIEKLQKVYADIPMKFPKIERDEKVLDIDPFTVFGLFNKGITMKNRQLILRGIAKEFSIEKEIPSDFRGVPVLHNQKATFFYFVEERLEQDIEHLWDMFEIALNLADHPTSHNRTVFEACYDKVIQQKGIRWNLTIGFYWIRPNFYVNLDARNRAFILSENILKNNFIKEIKTFRQMPNGKQYLQLCEAVSIAMIREMEYKYASFPELSFAAFAASKKNPQIHGQEVAENEILENPVTTGEFHEKSLQTEDMVSYNDHKEESIMNIGKNTILYGPPGTGKTYHTIIYAVAIIENKRLEVVKEEDYGNVLMRYQQYKAEGFIEFTTFHQSYGYEEFIEGIRPVMGQSQQAQNNIQYEIASGLFKTFCEKASPPSWKQQKGNMEGKKKNYVFIIDEINRGNISKIFGELITLIEPTKRVGEQEGMQAKLPYSKQLFGVPNNVYLIGTMNTADRSVASIDTALRRRFHFKAILPDAKVLEDIFVEGIAIKDMLMRINQRISLLFDKEHTIGHGYFLPLKNKPTIEMLANIFTENIMPLLLEYFYEDYEKIRLVLGDNKKANPEEQFIRVVSSDYNELFGNTDYDFDEMNTYEINEAAFYNIRAYGFI